MKNLVLQFKKLTVISARSSHLFSRYRFPSTRTIPAIRVIRKISNSNKTEKTWWNALNEEEKENLALSLDYPGTAVIAFYKGKALKKFGVQYAGDAIASFREAIQMDPEYLSLCQAEIEAIYRSLEKSKNLEVTVQVTELQTFDESPILIRGSLPERKGNTQNSLVLLLEKYIQEHEKRNQLIEQKLVLESKTASLMQTLIDTDQKSRSDDRRYRKFYQSYRILFLYCGGSLFFFYIYQQYMKMVKNVAKLKSNITKNKIKVQGFLSETKLYASKHLTVLSSFFPVNTDIQRDKINQTILELNELLSDSKALDEELRAMLLFPFVFIVNESSSWKRNLETQIRDIRILVSLNALFLMNPVLDELDDTSFEKNEEMKNIFSELNIGKEKLSDEYCDFIIGKLAKNDFNGINNTHKIKDSSMLEIIYSLKCLTIYKESLRVPIHNREIKTSQLKKAFGFCLSAINENLFNSHNWSNLGCILIELGKCADETRKQTLQMAALNCHEYAYKLTPTDSDVLHAFALYHCNKTPPDHDRAIDFLDTAIEQPGQTENLALLYHKGVILFEQGEMADAAFYLNIVYKFSVNHTDTIAYLALVEADINPGEKRTYRILNTAIDCDLNDSPNSILIKSSLLATRAMILDNKDYKDQMNALNDFKKALSILDNSLISDDMINWSWIDKRTHTHINVRDFKIFLNHNILRLQTILFTPSTPVGDNGLKVPANYSSLPTLMNNGRKEEGATKIKYPQNEKPVDSNSSRGLDH